MPQATFIPRRLPGALAIGGATSAFCAVLSRLGVGAALSFPIGGAAGADLSAAWLVDVALSLQASHQSALHNKHMKVTFGQMILFPQASQMALVPISTLLCILGFLNPALGKGFGIIINIYASVGMVVSLSDLIQRIKYIN